MNHLKLALVAIFSTIFATAAIAADGDWTGFYAGGQVGMTSLDVTGAPSDLKGTVFGVHVGYMHDFGKVVAGIEADYDKANLDVPAPLTVDADTTRIKARLGYDFGRALGYGFIASSHISIDSNFGKASDTGTGFGLGVSFKATEHILVTGEIARDSYTVFGTDIDADTFTIRASYQF